MTRRLLDLFVTRFSEPVREIVPIKAHASDRKIYRLRSDVRSVVGVIHRSEGENRAFVEFTRHFKKFSLPVPEIYAEDLDRGVYLQEDLGDTTLYDLLSAAEREGKIFPKEIEAIYRQVISFLPRFQIEAGKTLDYRLCFPVSEYGKESMLWDMNYFRDSFLARTSIVWDNKKLEKDFQTLANALCTAPHDFFLYRDFQARNIMVKDGKPFFIDYQSGRRGAIYYDLATLLYQSKVTIPADARARLTQEYLKEAARYTTIDKGAFAQYFTGFTLVQFLHRFGAYGRFGLGAGKRYFAESIPPALKKIAEILQQGPLPCELPELVRVCGVLTNSTEFGANGEPYGLWGRKDMLHVKVCSFAYKNGIPVFTDGESRGGFVFDCRSIQNPGREEAYKAKTGLDAEVIDFLEKLPEVSKFRENVFSLIEESVKRYLERGFTELIICFGCTGGQHRSVFFSEAVLSFLSAQYPVRVSIIHRELAAKGMLPQ